MKKGGYAEGSGTQHPVDGGYAEGSGTQHPVDGRHLCASQLVELSQKGRAEQEPLKQGLPLEEEVKVASQFEQHLSRAVAEQQRQTQQEWDLRLSSRLSIEVERSSLLQGVINKRLYICGGLDESRQPLNSVEAFTPPGVSVQMPHCTPRERQAAAGNGNWQVMPAMAERRGWPAAVSLQGLLYVCGGRDEQREPLSSVERLNHFPSIWLPLPAMSSQRAGASAAACGGRLYVCGGAFGAQMLNSVERFDPKVGTWETLPPMTARRAYVAAATIAGTIHVFGGSDGGQCLLSSERFDPTLNTWSPLPDMNERRSGAASVALMI